MRTLLRTLTEKSKIGFGKFAEQTVGDVLRINNRNYLAWLYYNTSNITFAENILKDIGIFRDRIKKPGKAPELFKGKIVAHKNTLQRMKIDNNYKKTKKVSSKAYMKSRESRWNNKASLAWKNQGH